MILPIGLDSGDSIVAKCWMSIVIRMTLLAPICAERFRAQGDAPARIAELAKANSWEHGSVVEKSGYATMPGSKTSDSDVARACAEMLANSPVPKT